MKNENRDATVRNATADTLLIEDVQEIKVAGVTIKVGGGVIQVVGSTVQQPANDTAIAAAKQALEIGAKMTDGSIYAGLTADGEQQIFAMPTDLDVTMTFNDAAKAVQKLNNEKTLGHNDWQIPALETLRVLQRNRDEGKLKGTFKGLSDATGSDYATWYWSSTRHPECRTYVGNVSFLDDKEHWDDNDKTRQSCRPVRLSPVSRMACAPRY